MTSNNLIDENEDDKNSNNNNSPDPYFVLRGHRSFINSIVFDKSNHNLLFSGSGDGDLRLWNIEEKKCIVTLPRAHPEGGTLALQSNEFNTLLSQGRDGTIRCWNITDSSITLKNTIETNSISLGKFASLVQSNEFDQSSSSNSNESFGGFNNIIAISSDEVPGQVELWDLNSKQIATKIKPLDGIVGGDKLGMAMSLKLINNQSSSSSSSPSSTLIFAGYENGGLYMWDVRNPTEPLLSSKLHQEPILSFDIQSNQGVSGGGDTSIIEFQLNYDNRTFDIIEKHTINNNGISDVKIRKDNKIFATAGWDRRVRIYNFRKHTPLAILKYHTESIYTLDFSNDIGLLASAGKDMKIALWSIYK